MSVLWALGALFVTAVSAWVRRGDRHLDSFKYWAETAQTFLFLAGLMAAVRFAVWLAT